MNILVVGNGFDLAHDLPTSYKDFLYFTDAFIEFKTERQVLGKQIPVKEDAKEKQLIIYLVELFNKSSKDVHAQELINEIDKLVENNKWIEHFNNINIAQGWIDFESEISQVIQTFDELRVHLIYELRNSGKGVKLTPHQIAVLKPFIGQASLITSTVTIDSLKNTLLNDLNRLIRCLEIYLCDYVEKIPIKKKLSDIEKLDIHAVLSFNYTDTYRANYIADATKIKCDFIHGKANIKNTKETCNMVIGIDEYLEGSDRKYDTEYIQFKKFFQRIYKATGNNYVDWLQQIKPRPEERYFPNETNIYIYGHSLDATDKDILAALITAENTKTTIFYHNQEALEKQIINLVKVISEDELIHRTGIKKIIFQKTKET